MDLDVILSLGYFIQRSHLLKKCFRENNYSNIQCTVYIYLCRQEAQVVGDEDVMLNNESRLVIA